MFLTVFVTLFQLLFVQASHQPYGVGFPIGGCVDAGSHDCHIKYIHRSTAVVWSYRNIPVFLWSPKSQIIVPIYYFFPLCVFASYALFASEVTVFVLHTHTLQLRVHPLRVSS